MPDNFPIQQEAGLFVPNRLDCLPPYNAYLPTLPTYIAYLHCLPSLPAYIAYLHCYTTYIAYLPTMARLTK